MRSPRPGSGRTSAAAALAAARSRSERRAPPATRLPRAWRARRNRPPPPSSPRPWGAWLEGWSFDGGGRRLRGGRRVDGGCGGEIDRPRRRLGRRRIVPGQIQREGFDAQGAGDALQRGGIDGLLAKYPIDDVLGRRAQPFQVGHALGERSLCLQPGCRQGLVQFDSRRANAAASQANVRVCHRDRRGFLFLGEILTCRK